MRGRKRRSFDFGNFEITKREILVSVSIVAIMLLIIEHCATARAYSKLRENGVMTKMSDVEAGIIKIGKEKEDARKNVES